ncbi:MAG: hypothetical protein JKY43_07785 [Phycisphaerales bacterium]|nr:hypothetical protein [Phycisphaerales bacterium]
MSRTSKNENKIPVAGYFVGIGFLITAGALILTGASVEVPQNDSPAVRAAQIVPGVWRVALSDPPIMEINSMEMRCNHCHFIDMKTRDQARVLVQHTDIELSHGSNDACLNCHDSADREKLTLRNGETVGFDHVEQLCAQCHGPIYRDWQKGIHGKTIGYWDTDLGPATKLSCTECHDPHSPAYDPMPLLPGPNTLRMGKQHGALDLIDERNPLQRWRLKDSGAHGSSGTSQDGGDH